MKNEGMLIKCLDHGFVRLVDSMGGDLSIVRAARVSYDAAWRAGEDEKGDERLIGYLMRNSHTTPFEAVQFTFEVKAPIFVLRQWHRHRIGWSYNELSARYRELPEEYYVPEAEKIGVQSKDNKQGRDIGGSGAVGISVPPPALADNVWAASVMHTQNKSAFITYKALLEIGVPRELARGVLPVATYSHMFASANLHALFHLLRLRLHAHAQYESRVYAEAMLYFAECVAPVATEHFKKTLVLS